MPKILFSSCLGISPPISSQFNLKMALQPKIVKKLLENPFWEFKVV